MPCYAIMSTTFSISTKSFWLLQKYLNLKLLFKIYKPRFRDFSNTYQIFQQNLHVTLITQWICKREKTYFTSGDNQTPLNFCVHVKLRGTSQIQPLWGELLQVLLAVSSSKLEFEISALQWEPHELRFSKRSHLYFRTDRSKLATNGKRKIKN